MEETKTKKVQLSDGSTVTVSKFALGKYAKLVGMIDEIPAELMDIDTQDNSTLLKTLPKILSKFADPLFKALALASGTKAEDWEEKYDLLDAVNVLSAFFELNDFLAVREGISRMGTLFKRKPQEMERIGSKS